MNDEEREERKEQMRKSLEIAFDVWSLLGDHVKKAEAAGNPIADLHIDEVMVVVRKRFDVPLHAAREEALGHSIANAVSRYGITSCGLWSFAHQLDHCIFEDDLSEIEEAIARMR